MGTFIIPDDHTRQTITKTVTPGFREVSFLTNKAWQELFQTEYNVKDVLDGHWEEGMHGLRRTIEVSFNPFTPNSAKSKSGKCSKITNWAKLKKKK